jgi:hypothetical protein
MVNQELNMPPDPSAFEDYLKNNPSQHLQPVADRVVKFMCDEMDKVGLHKTMICNQLVFILQTALKEQISEIEGIDHLERAHTAGWIHNVFGLHVEHLEKMANEKYRKEYPNLFSKENQDKFFEELENESRNANNTISLDDARYARADHN